MHGSEPVKWFVKRIAVAANASRLGVVNSVPLYAASMWRLRLSSSTTTTLSGGDGSEKGMSVTASDVRGYAATTLAPDGRDPRPGGTW